MRFFGFILLKNSYWIGTALFTVSKGSITELRPAQPDTLRDSWILLKFGLSSKLWTPFGYRSYCGTKYLGGTKMGPYSWKLPICKVQMQLSVLQPHKIIPQNGMEWVR